MINKRYVILWFPQLQTDWLAIKRPELKDRNYVLTFPIRGRVVITAVSKMLVAQGISAGMPLADAKALIPTIEAFDDQPLLSQKILTKLGKWCIRFSPIVALDLPLGLILDCTGCTHLWGGEKRYLQTIIERLKEIGYDTHAAVADTIGGAWAMARYGGEMAIVSGHQQYEALLPLPPIALRIEHSIVQRLHKLGLSRIGHFIKMPRSVLRRRFGEDLLLKIGQALGTAEESIKPLVIIAPYEERLPCLEPICTKTGIEIAIRKLLELLCDRLSKEGMGVRNVILKGYRIDGKITQVQIGTSQATHHIEHLCKLFGLKIGQIEPALGIELFTLSAIKTSPVLIHQEQFWSGKPGLADQGLAQLLDRLAGKIGEQAIHRYLPRAHYWPERSYQLASSLTEQPEVTWPNRPRPIQLLAKPEPVQVTAPIPDYPPMNFRYKDILHFIKKADGPERIEREWWLEKGEHRDYYIVEDEKGQRYWLFRSGHYSAEDARWFIHGFFA